MWIYLDLAILCNHTNPEEGRIALSVVAHCKVVWLWPQDLHNVLIELGLFFLQRKIWELCSEESQLCSSSLISSCQWQSYPALNARALWVMDAGKKWIAQQPGAIYPHSYNHINSPLAERATATLMERQGFLNYWKKCNCLCGGGKES